MSGPAGVAGAATGASAFAEPQAAVAHTAASSPPRAGAQPPRADEVWAALMNLTTHNLREWRKAVSDELNLPFGRVRVLRRLGERPMGMKELAEASGIDAPAATVAVNDLERNGLVERLIDPANRRAKTVSLTPAGVDALGRVDRVRPAAPPAFAALGDDDLDALQSILLRVERAASAGASASAAADVVPVQA